MPDTVGDTPLTNCRYTGNSAMVPNMPMPTSTPTALTTTNTLLRNNASGRIGSSARRSASTNPTSAASASPISPTMAGLPHGRTEPPMFDASTTEASRVASRPAPA